MSAPDDDLGFAPEDDAPIPYMQRIRDYHLALGYPTPYRWAHYATPTSRACRRKKSTACGLSSIAKRKSPGASASRPPERSKPPAKSTYLDISFELRMIER